MPRLHPAEELDRLARARVATLGTLDEGGRVNLVPCCFAIDTGRPAPVAYSAVDDKAKTTSHLRRLENVASRPVATLLVDHYEEDWARLWWVRAGGPARVVSDGSERQRALGLVRAKYPQYETHRLDGPVLAVSLDRWLSWTSAGPR